MSDLPTDAPAHATSPAHGQQVLRAHLDEAAHGDLEAFMRFYDATCDDAYRLARCLLPDADAAAVVTRSYVTAWRLAGSFPATGRSPRTWLLSLLHRELADASVSRTPRQRRAS